MNEVVHLTGRQRRVLESLLKTQCDFRQYQRALALLLLDEGDTAGIQCTASADARIRSAPQDSTPLSPSYRQAPV